MVLSFYIDGILVVDASNNANIKKLGVVNQIIEMTMLKKEVWLTCFERIVFF